MKGIKGVETWLRVHGLFSEWERPASVVKEGDCQVLVFSVGLRMGQRKGHAMSEDFKIKAMMLRNTTDGEARMRLLGTMAGNSR